MAITEFSKNYHEKMFPKYHSAFLETDPEFIERFDNFAFAAQITGFIEISEISFILLKSLWQMTLTWKRSQKQQQVIRVQTLKT